MFPYETNAIFISSKCKRHNKYYFVSFGLSKKKNKQEDSGWKEGIHREIFPRVSKMYCYLSKYCFSVSIFFSHFLGGDLRFVWVSLNDLSYNSCLFSA